MYGHVATLAKKEKEGVEKAGGKVDMYQYVLPRSGHSWSSVNMENSK